MLCLNNFHENWLELNQKNYMRDFGQSIYCVRDAFALAFVSFTHYSNSDSRKVNYANKAGI